MLTEKESTRVSKFLSLVLRHAPEAIGLQLDARGWAEVSQLLRQAKAFGKPFSREELDYVVATNAKKRFAFSDDQQRIRASQGHSVEIDLGYEPQVPPAILYHGTATKSLSAILKNGLEKRSRTHVHLSRDRATAVKVGERHGTPVILEVAAQRMHEAGYQFLLSANDVWLIDAVPHEYLTVQF